MIVAPLAGAWIEIWNSDIWETIFQVAPLAGAWIEICTLWYMNSSSSRRSPRGSVD